MAPLTNGWYQSANDPFVIVNDKFPPLRKSDMTGVYPIRVKADPRTGSFDYYHKGGGAFGSDLLMFQMNANRADGKLAVNEKTGFHYNDFFEGKKESYNGGILTKTKGEIYSQAVPEEKRRLDLKAAYAGYNQLLAAPPGAAPGAQGAAPGAQGAAGTQGPNSGAQGTQGPGSVVFATTISKFASVNLGSWSYPTDMNETQDYMYISTFEYVVPDVTTGGTEGNFNITSLAEGANLSKRTFKNNVGNVILPIPNNITEQNVTGWGEDSLSSLSALAMGGATELAGAVAAGDLSTAAGIANVAGNAAFKGAAGNTIKQLLTLNAGAAIVKKLGLNINPEAYRARVSGTVINPNLELLFNGPKLRTFSFEIKMAPRSKKEAMEIRGIIKFFKKAMAPKRASSAEDSFFLGTPNVFRIAFKQNGGLSKTLPQLKTCALTQFNANYTPDGFYASFAADGQPISVTINMTFSELVPVYYDNYNEQDDSVGFRSEDLNELEDPSFNPTTNPPAGAQGSQGSQGSQPSRGGAGFSAQTGVFNPGGPLSIPADSNQKFQQGPDPVPTFGGVRGV